ncbi:MAG: L,D-transpeptidase family protein [Eubacterium sp.]|nr:L,D-transpeptidase family protein [Eubacterium sp.]
MKKQNTSTNTKSSSGIHNRIVKAALIASAVLITLLLGFILGLRIYYNSHWYPNTWIGDRDVSGMKCEESAELMNYVYGNFQLNIYGRDNGSLTITQNQIDYTVDIQDSVQEQFDKQHESFPVFSLGKKKQVDLSLNAVYDTEKLTEILENSEIYAGSNSYDIVKPQNAKVVFSKEKQYLTVQKEITGNTISLNALLGAVENSLETGHEKLDLTDEQKNPDVYEKPQLVSTDPELQKKADVCNVYALRWLTWKIDKDVTETVGPEQIYSWCKYNNGKVSFKKMAIRNWVEKLCLKYKTVGMTRTFKNHAGKKIKVSGGDYGWAFDYEAMVKQLMKVLKKEIDPQLQQAYMENPDKAQKKALTFSKEPPYANTAYRYDYENKANDWDTKNFTEISLSDQKVYVWRKGKVVFSCRCISGRPVPDRQTRKGAYFIKEHQPHRVLKGDDYETPVDNWVRIMWTGTGFHAAPWQPWSSWTKTLYQTRGSHGCLNLSVEDSAKIYKLTTYREMVFIY